MDPDPHQGEKSEPDPYPDPHPDPRLDDKKNPDPFKT
jgi:hypothetical protein